MYLVKFRYNTFHESCLAILDQMHAMHGDTNRSIIKSFLYSPLSLPLSVQIGDFIVTQLRTFAVGWR